MHNQKKKKTSRRKRKQKSTTSKKEPFGYQPDNPLTMYYAKYIEADKIK